MDDRQDTASKPLSRDVSTEHSVVDVDATPTSVGSGGTASKEEGQQGVFGRFRKSFSSRSKYKKLKQKNESLRKDIAILQEELLLLRKRLAKMVENNTYHGVQVGDHNTMINAKNIDSINVNDVEGLLSEIETLICKQTEVIDIVIEERTMIERDLENHKVILGEMKETLTRFNNKYEEKIYEDRTRFHEVKTLLQDLQSDRSDESVLSNCIEGLTEEIHAKNKELPDFNSLPVRIQSGITRLVNKFRAMTWKEFARRLNLNSNSVSKLMTDDSAHDEKALDKEICTKVMATWVSESKHTFDVFMLRIKEIELEITKESKQDFIAVINKRSTSTLSLCSRGSHKKGINTSQQTDQEWFTDKKMELYRMSHEQRKATIASLAPVPGAIDKHCRDLLAKMDEYLVYHWLYKCRL